MLLFKKSQIHNFGFETYERDNYHTVMSNSYQLPMHIINEFENQNKQFTIQAFTENYPNKFAILYSFVIILIGSAEITLQIFSILYRGSFYYIAPGIWAGTYCILLGILALFLVKWKNLILIYLNFFANTFISLVFTSLITINGLGISYYFDDNPYPLNKENFIITISILVLGVMATIMCILYLVVLCKLGVNRRNFIYPT